LRFARGSSVPELWFCMDCRSVLALDRHGRCSACGSDSVVSNEVRRGNGSIGNNQPKTLREHSQANRSLGESRTEFWGGEERNKKPILQVEICRLVHVNSGDAQAISGARDCRGAVSEP